MRRLLLPATLLTLLLSGATADAEQRVRSGPERPALLELYTSEGCSSCPPADAWVADLVDDPALWRDVVPVVFHVTWWDRLGWPDEFADPAHDRRQRRLARRSGAGVYTPGLFVDGREWRGWWRREATPASDSTAPGVLELTVGEEDVRVRFEAAEAAVASGDALLVRIAWLRGATTSVRAGENRGRRLRHEFTVARMDDFALAGRDGVWSGAAPLAAPELPDAPAVAIWLEDSDGRVIQAAGAWLSPAG